MITNDVSTCPKCGGDLKYYHKPTVEDILPIMDRIITADKVINKIREEEG